MEQTYYEKNKEKLKAYQAVWREKNREKRNLHARKKYKENRENWEKYIESLGFHKCYLCKYEGVAIDIHHLNNKKFALSKFKNRPCNQKNRGLFFVEIENCIPLCANCHREVHAGVKKIRKDARPLWRVGL